MASLVFDSFYVSFIYDKELDDLTSPRKLACLANHDGMVFDKEIFSYITRYEFPELFDAMFEEAGWAGTLDLERLLLHKSRIDFCFCLMKDRKKEFAIGIPLDGTSGRFQAYEGDGRYVNVAWENGAIVKASRIVNGSSTPIQVPD